LDKADSKLVWQDMLFIRRMEELVRECERLIYQFNC
jgi:hypothetical protein